MIPGLKLQISAGGSFILSDTQSLQAYAEV
jgi:hypothetical protein